jgi:predicted anti-sigma-YlaC factor YlaD
MTIKRRQVIKLCSSLPLAFLAVDFSAVAALISTVEIQPLTALIGKFPHLQQCQAIGQVYLQQYRNVDELNQLHWTIAKRFRARDRQSDPGDWLRKQIRTDFAQNNIVRVEGWILSKTEAQLCALAYSEKQQTIN